MPIDFDTLPQNVPIPLIELYIKLGCSQRAVARWQDVNDRYVNKLFKYGEEPTDKTKKGRYARKALFLPERRTRKGQGEVIPDYVRKFRRLPKEEKYKVMEQYIAWKERNNR